MVEILLRAFVLHALAGRLLKSPAAGVASDMDCPAAIVGAAEFGASGVAVTSLISPALGDPTNARLCFFLQEPALLVRDDFFRACSITDEVLQLHGNGKERQSSAELCQPSSCRAVQPIPASCNDHGECAREHAPNR